jgi:hypothetical protein
MNPSERPQQQGLLCFPSLLLGYWVASAEDIPVNKADYSLALIKLTLGYFF